MPVANGVPSGAAPLLNDSGQPRMTIVGSSGTDPQIHIKLVDGSSRPPTTDEFR